MTKCANPKCTNDAPSAQFLCVMCWVRIPSRQRMAFAEHKNALKNVGEDIMRALNASVHVDVEVVFK